MRATDSVYETAAAAHLGAAHAVAFGFARHALQAVLAGAGLVEGDEVLLSPLTCKVIPLTLLSAGISPVYVDITADGLNIDPARAAARVGPRTRAILFQHTYGDTTGLADITAVAARAGCLLIEDCAQSMPERRDDYRPGSGGRAAIFSNNLLKPLPAGSGGLAVTDDDALADRIRQHRDRLPRRSAWQEFARRAEVMAFRALVGPRTYWTIFGAYARVSPSYRIRDVRKEIGAEITDLAFRPSRAQLAAGQHWTERAALVSRHRRQSVEDYRRLLRNSRATADIHQAADAAPLLYFPVLMDRKPDLLNEARRRRLQVVAWPGSTPMYPIEQMDTLTRYGYVPGSCPAAEATASRLVGLPTEPEVTAGIRQAIARMVLDLERR
jgi:dTDP-4-amino-4,6-dideoxygalactose transaminase